MQQAEHLEAPADVTVLLFYGAAPDPLPRINAWLGEQGYQRGLVEIEDGSLPRDWYVTTGKGMECEIAVGTFLGFRLDAFIRFLRQVPWTDDEPYVQVCALRHKDQAFRLHPVWPLDYGTRTLATFGGVEVLDRELGPAHDPLIVLTGDPGVLAPGALDQVRRWLSDNAPGSALREVPDPNITALGMYDYGRPKVGFVVTGTFDHGWCKRLADFLPSVTWASEKGKLGVYLLTGSESGWRTQTYVRSYWPYTGPSDRISGWLLGEIRDMAALAFSGGGRVAPLADDLARFDELCLHYIAARGYTVDRGGVHE